MKELDAVKEISFSNITFKALPVLNRNSLDNALQQIDVIKYEAIQVCARNAGKRADFQVFSQSSNLRLKMKGTDATMTNSV